MVPGHLVPHNWSPINWSLWTNGPLPILSPWTNGPQPIWSPWKMVPRIFCLSRGPSCNDLERWGPNWLGTICQWGPNFWGLFVHGDRKWGTGSPGIKWARDQMRCSLPRQPKISSFIDLSLHWVSKVLASAHKLSGDKPPLKSLCVPSGLWAMLCWPVHSDAF